MSDLRTSLQSALGPSYVVGRELSGGGMSRVFTATDTSLDREVVVKVLHSELSTDAAAERFAREMRVTAALQHPHIVPVIAAGVVDGTPYYSMPFIAGEDLRQRLKRERQMSVADTVHLVEEIAGALTFAHARGVVHRDLKPGNILLSAGHALLSDFGIATALEQSDVALTPTGLSLGTPAYMAPEQISGLDRIDARADIYALGCLTYELLTGQRPFTGATAQSVIGQHMVAPFPHVRHSRPDVPQGIDAAIQKATAKAPSDRFNSATEFAAALRAALASPAGTVNALSAARRRWPLAALGAAIIIAAIVALMSMRRRDASGVQPTEKSVAVLPLVNVGGDTTNLYYADGITDAIVGGLSGLPGLAVTSRASTFAFRNSHLTARQVGETLHVGALLDGSVQRDGDRIRIAVELVDPRRDGVLWHRTFDGKRADVFGMQDSIAKAVVGALAVQLAGGGERTLAKAVTANPEAYDAYLRGRYFLGRRDSVGLAKAREYFDQAIALDPRFATAYAGLAETYADLTVFGFVAPSAVRAKAIEAATRSLTLDESTAEGHTARAFVAYMLDWDFATAHDEFARALSIDPRYAPAYLYRSTLRLAVVDTAGALRDIRDAVRLDPYSLIANTRYATQLYFARQFREAGVQARHVREMDSTFLQARAELARAELALGQCDAAFVEVRGMPRLRLETLPVHGLVYATCGHAAEADTELAHLADQRRHGTYVSHVADAMITASLGRNEVALAHLDTAVDEHSWGVLLARTDPVFDHVRKSPRFTAIVGRVGK